MKTFVQLLINEFIKLVSTKRIILLSFTIVLFFIALFPITAREKFLKVASSFVLENNPYIGFYYSTYFFFSIFFMIVLNFLVFFLFSTEQNNHTWKYLYVLPVERWKIWLSKYIIGVGFSFFVLCLGLLLTILSSFLLPYFIISMHSSGFDMDFYFIFRLFSKLFIVSLYIVIFHLILVFFIKKRAILLLLNIFLPIISHYRFLYFLPYSFPVQILLFENYYKVETGKYADLWGWFEIISISLTLSIGYAIYYGYQKLEEN